MDLSHVSPCQVRAVAQAMRERDLAEFSAVLPYDTRDEIAEWMAGAYGERNGLLVGSLRGVPICVGGAVPTRPGSAALLFLATDRFGEIALPMTRFIRNIYFPNLHDTGTHRIECITHAAYRTMHRWLGTLGMEREAEFPAYGKRREAFVQFARVQ
ncbi:hypothetical protein [Methylorubrum zatmanii]